PIRENAFENGYRGPRTRVIARPRPKALGLLTYLGERDRVRRSVGYVAEAIRQEEPEHARSPARIIGARRVRRPRRDVAAGVGRGPDAAVVAVVVHPAAIGVRRGEEDADLGVVGRGVRAARRVAPSTLHAEEVGPPGKS